MLEKISTPKERALAESAISDVAHNDVASLSRKAVPEVRPKLAAAMQQMRYYLPAAGIERVELVDARFVVGSARESKLAYQLSGKGQNSLAEVTILTANGGSLIEGLYISKLRGSVQDLNRFELGGKSAAQYSILGLALLAFGITVAAVVKVWRSGAFRRRWLWTLGCLVGVTTLRIDWTGGDWSFQPLSFQLFSASASQLGVLAPWVIGVSIPLAAIIVLARRHREPNDAEDVAPVG